ncbi:MAG: nitrate reductase cytochrome c-type subunit [Roseibium album]|uniref:Periplasmic nitrate reductase, electron transfer subunit n=1 Tax=Roseibium album TaxID=311410 RepID=A0A0M7AGM4_9HYPH|nr:nitrate reductase cytochrome c-type subunit [Roseibium album]MBG6142797.1 cytochrome c-type protein NapB [Labrenzia sp. EL_142]MBG6158170.1 cytochrome c-type protein NapB [Labrenzia sp. EL_162]MBG6166631.1 cytochrome c-type protein NapB [Labrenzia sp. EL_195]MBG6172789.1 cytochrome c-type protein NapB [Labrenzia sp. EL_132]MBG6196818.1 cytochrome c-type protein NapB [Labrenzia sp. EL_159]MBG6202841.1 cytochrome c-type protein NapB [Labrenzia sp. EL_13]MBG6226992.1 cytochrome c-type protei
MKKSVLAGVAALAVLVGIGGFAVAQQDQVKAMRSDPVDELNRLGPDFKWAEKEGRMQRNYRQQPPLIPHSIAQYQIDIRTNQCLSCHDWTKAGERGAPTLSMTHYLDREGNELDHIAGTRYFCNQCHVPQADVPALVDNQFEPSAPIQTR